MHFFVGRKVPWSSGFGFGAVEWLYGALQCCALGLVVADDGVKHWQGRCLV